MVDTTPLVEREQEQEKKIGHRFCGKYYVASSPCTCCVKTQLVIVNNSCSYPLLSSTLYTLKGCCCDSRRAVLVFNILNLIFYFITIILSAGASNTSIGAFWAFYIVGAAVFALAIAGAVCYNRWLVAPAALWAVISLVITIAYTAKGVRQVFEVNGTVYYVSPVATIILAAIWQGLCGYVSIFFYLLR